LADEEWLALPGEEPNIRWSMGSSTRKHQIVEQESQRSAFNGKRQANEWKLSDSKHWKV